jgi:hypothetical protein
MNYKDKSNKEFITSNKKLATTINKEKVEINNVTK